MKKVRKITAFMLSVMTGMNFLGTGVCSATAASPVYEGYDMSRTETVISEFEESLSKSDNFEKVLECYENMIHEADYVNYQLSLSKVQFSVERSEENYNEYVLMSAKQMEAFSKIAAAMMNAAGTEYNEPLSAEIDENYCFKLNEGYYELSDSSEEFLNKENELYQKYMNTLDSDLSESEKEYECAKIYLDTVKLFNSRVESDEYNYMDYAYQSYARDYSQEDIAKLNDIVAEKVLSAYISLAQRYETVARGRSPLEVTFEDNMKIVDQFSYRISDELKENAEKMIKNGLYVTGSGDSEELSYTTQLSYINSAIIYQYLYGSVTDFRAATHEFGHFNAMNSYSIPFLYISSNNLDIAEVQSQGLEVLYTEFYGEIFGENAEMLRLNEAMGLLSAIAAGFQGNEFECYVFAHADEMTPEDVISKYKELSEKYVLYNREFYRVPHFFEMPGYYISYAVSALAALDLWNIMYRDFDRAADIYTDFSHVSMYDGTGFSSALSECGFDDVLSENFINVKLSGFAEMLTSGRVYGDVNGSSTINALDLTCLIKMIISSGDYSDEELKNGDLDENGAVDAADLLKLKNIMLK